MGYESKLYVVEKNKVMDYEKNESLHYCNVIAMIDLCKCHPFSDWMRKQPATDCYFYADDGNTKITEDRYGDPLKEAPIEDVLAALEEAQADENYRKYRVAIGMMRSFVENKDSFGPLVVLHYGY